MTVVVQALVDGVDVTPYVLDGSTTHMHNQPSQVTIMAPTRLAPWAPTSRLKLVLDGSTLDFHGACSAIEHSGTESDPPYSKYTFTAPSAILEYRPMRDGAASGDPGDFSKPSVIARLGTAPQIMEEVLTQSLIAGDPPDAEGPAGFTLGTFATGGANLAGAPADYPMQISELQAMLAETGQLDMVETFIDSAGSMSQLSYYNGNYGTDRSGSVAFRYAEGSASNCRACRWTQDLSELMNKLWIYLGPRVKKKTDPQGDQHWAASITGTSGFPSLPRLDSSVVLAARDASQASYFVRMLIRIFDGDESVALDLFKGWWLTESWLRLKPKQLISVTPHRGISPAFRCGDLIRVSAGTDFAGGFNKVQRVMGYSYRWTRDGPIELGEPIGAPVGTAAVVTTSDQEGSS